VTSEQAKRSVDRPWTQDEAAEFAQTLRTFRDGLPSRQRDAFDAILHASAQAAGGDDVQGYAEFHPIVKSFLPSILVTLTDPNRIERPNWTAPATKH